MSLQDLKEAEDSFMTRVEQYFATLQNPIQVSA